MAYRVTADFWKRPSKPTSCCVIYQPVRNDLHGFTLCMRATVHIPSESSLALWGRVRVALVAFQALSAGAQILNPFAMGTGGRFRCQRGEENRQCFCTIVPSPGAKSAKSANYSRFGDREDGGFSSPA